MTFSPARRAAHAPLYFLCTGLYVKNSTFLCGAMLFLPHMINFHYDVYFLSVWLNKVTSPSHQPTGYQASQPAEIMFRLLYAARPFSVFLFVFLLCLSAVSYKDLRRKLQSVQKK